jgi:biotin synthase-like enzyme
MVKGVNDLGMEVCCTLGMLTEEQAIRLQEAGLYAYNHNLDTSEQYYEEIISTRTLTTGSILLTTSEKQALQYVPVELSGLEKPTETEFPCC